MIEYVKTKLSIGYEHKRESGVFPSLKIFTNALKSNIQWTV